MATRRPRAFLAVVVLILLWLVVGGVAGPLSAKLTSVQENDNASYLPAIIVYERAGGIAADDSAKAAADAAALADFQACREAVTADPVQGRQGTSGDRDHQS